MMMMTKINKRQNDETFGWQEYGTDCENAFMGIILI